MKNGTLLFLCGFYGFIDATLPQDRKKPPRDGLHSF